MKRYFSVLICFCFCFSIFVGNFKRSEAAVIDASALFLSNAALTYAEASGMNALVSGMSAAEVGAAFSSSAVSGYAASVGTTEVALASTVGAGIVITPKTILITAAAAAVLAGIIAYVISQNTSLEQDDTPAVLSTQSYFLDAYGNKYPTVFPTNISSSSSYLFFTDVPIDYSYGYDLTITDTYILPSGYSIRVSPVSWSNNIKQVAILNSSGSVLFSESFNVSYTPDGSKQLPYPYLYFTVAYGRIYMVFPAVVGTSGFNASYYNYTLAPSNNANALSHLQAAFGFGSSSSVSSGSASLSLTRTSSFELPELEESDSLLITIPEDSNVTLDPTASSDTVLNPIVDGIFSETVSDRPVLTTQVVSEPQIEEPDIPENIDTPFLPDIVPPWHYVVQLIEDASDFVSVWFQTINSVLPDALSNSIWAAVVLLVTFGIVRRFLE